MKIKSPYSKDRRLLFVAFCLLFNACKPGGKETVLEDDAEVRTPVTVTTVSHEALQEFIELNATSAYLQKSYVKSNVTGYIRSVNIKYAGTVKAGQLLFTVKTKESDAIGNTINDLDPGFKFSGVNGIKAGAGGYVSELNHQAGDYVQDGEQLAVISNVNSFVFVMDLPYEYREYVNNTRQAELTLPGGEKLLAKIQSFMPFMDSVSQTQSVILKVNSTKQLPQNLVAKVRIVKAFKPAPTSLPKAAVLSDEIHAEFWVMKLINDSTAIKVHVQKGIETDAMIEIISPFFKADEKIIVTGNYGLADTAKIQVNIPAKN